MQNILIINVFDDLRSSVFNKYFVFFNFTE